MADSDKDILITPNRGHADEQPNIKFTTGGATTAHIEASDDGALRFRTQHGGEGIAITNDFNTPLTVHDVSGLPVFGIEQNGDSVTSQTSHQSIAAGQGVTTDGLFHWFDFSNSDCYSGSGSTVYDLMGHTNGTINNSPDFLGSGNAKYFQFDPTTGSGSSAEYIKIGSSIPGTFFQYYNAFTMEAWHMNYSVGANTSDGIAPIISSQDDNSQGGASINVDSRSSHGGGPNSYHFQAGVGSGFTTTGSEGNAPSGLAAVDNKWKHIVATWYSGGPKKVYLNGEEIDDAGTFSGTFLVSGTSWNIGAEPRDGAYARRYDGRIAIVRIYYTALTPDQIRRNFNAERTRFAV